jgi:NTE family protein
MRAYGIFAGGGVKGAAFAGCLRAAEDNGISFLGYGGTSAGSIVALLACVGYTPNELRTIFVNELAFQQLLDGSLDDLHALRELPTKLERIETQPVRGGASLWLSHRKLLAKLSAKLGMYPGNTFRGFIDKLVRDRLGVGPEVPLTFGLLKQRGLPALQILASDLHMRGPLVYSAQTHANVSVIDAVRASIGFPLVFEPFTIDGTRFVDGGLSCNLPISLYQEERKTMNVPVIAFDLIAAPEPGGGAYGLSRFLKDIAATALESSGRFLKDFVDGVYHVPVQIPHGIDTLDFELDEAARDRLYLRGYESAASSLRKLEHWAGARDSVQEVQALFVKPAIMDRLLGALVRDIEQVAGLAGVRANIMFPVRGVLRIVYHYRMENDPDLGLELRLDGGCAGFAYSTGEIQLADLAAALAQNKLEEWRMTRQQQNMIRRDRAALQSVPLFDSTVQYQEGEPRQARAVLNIDTSTPLPDTRWTHDVGDPSAGVILEWQDVLALVLFGK